MNLQYRIFILSQLGKKLSENSTNWNDIIAKANALNGWFTTEFIELSKQNIINEFLQKDKLEYWLRAYNLPEERQNPKTIGIICAGNIPFVGMHDLICGFLSGHKTVLKLSSKDAVLMNYVLDLIYDIEPETKTLIETTDSTLKNLDGYIATGSNNSSLYFEYYFAKYPHIIRKNRTSIAILTGNETNEDLENLADDIMTYYGLGCRNVTRLLVPQNYNFDALLTALKKYNYFIENNKYKNNFDYQLTLLLMNQKHIISNDLVLFVESESNFSPVSQVHYTYYKNVEEIQQIISNKNELQCIVGEGYTPFGKAQVPTLFDYADGIDAMQFLKDDL